MKAALSAALLLGAAASGAVLLRRATLADPPALATLQNAAFPASIPASSPIRVGSLFSGSTTTRSTAPTCSGA